MESTMKNTMRNTLLITAATAALATGASLASAQGMGDRRESPPAAAQAPEGKTDQRQGTAPQKSDQVKPRQGAQAPDKTDKTKAAPTAQAPDKTDKTKAAPTAQAPEKTTPAPGAQLPDKAKPAPIAQGPGGSQPGSAQPQQGGQSGPGAAGTAQGQPVAGASTSISVQQRTQIRETVFKQSNAPRVSKVDFDMRVGVAVPRSMNVVVLPDDVTRVHPAWRGYVYFIVGDEIIVCEPGTLRIVAILQA
jgi:uncharacterized protein DUF1236